MSSISAPNSHIVLPGIYSLFPEHVPRSPQATPPKNKFLTPLDIPRSDSDVTAIQQLTIRPSYHLSAFALERVPPSDEEPGGSGNGEGEGSRKKYVCSICLKRFDRPSSLRTHANTHTGATPFRCPHPGCRRAFNIDSNMRRHFRSHMAEASLFCVAPQGPHASLALSPFSASPFTALSASDWNEDASPLAPISAPRPTYAYSYIPSPASPASAHADDLSPVSSWDPNRMTGPSESDVRTSR